MLAPGVGSHNPCANQMPDPETLDCPHGARCGGCVFLGVPYADQLRRKGAVVQRDFARYAGHGAVKLLPVVGASTTHAYRVRAKLVFGADGALGLYARDSHHVVDIPDCRVLEPALLRVTEAARRALSDAALAGLDLRLVDNGVQVTLIAPQGTALEALKSLAAALRAESPDVLSVAASFRMADSATLLGTGHVLLLGNDVETHRLTPSGPYHFAAHGAFAQAHLGQALAAHTAIERELHALGARRVLELYAGSGALALRLAAAGFDVTAVESFAPACAQAEAAARAQRLSLTTHAGNAEGVLSNLCAESAPFDALVVNPPRRGLSPEVRRGAARLGPRAILYMSCNPATLARDLGHLRLLGYEATEVAPFDMIPHSAAVECLVTVRRAAIPPALIVFEDDELLAVSKSAYEDMTGLLQRVRALPSAALAVPIPALGLDRDSSGLCLFARTPEALPAALRACAASAQRFIALSRGITHKKGCIRRPVRAGRRKVPASTPYQRAAVHAGNSLLTLTPEHGDASVIRQHLASIAHPILGDARFGASTSNTFFEHRHGLDRCFLHRSALTLGSGTRSLVLEAPLPGELNAVLDSLSEQAAPGG